MQLLVANLCYMFCFPSPYLKGIYSLSTWSAFQVFASDVNNNGFITAQHEFSSFLPLTKVFLSLNPQPNTSNIFPSQILFFWVSQGGLGYSSIIKTSKFQCLETTKAYTCSYYIAILGRLEANAPWCPRLGTEADGAATIWNIASYYDRWKESPKGSQSTIKFSVSEVTLYTSTNDSLARPNIIPQSYHKQIRTHNPKTGLEDRDLFVQEQLWLPQCTKISPRWRMTLWPQENFSK